MRVESGDISMKVESGDISMRVVSGDSSMCLETAACEWRQQQHENESGDRSIRVEAAA